MLTTVAEWLARRSSILITVLAVLIVTGLAVSLAYCSGRTSGKQGVVIDQQTREIDAQASVGAANDVAAVSRVDDAVKAEKQAKELNDALQAQNDPDRQRVLRGCVVLRQQGRDTSNIPACSGSANGR